MLVSNKHFIPVVGIDIHIVILLGFPVPLPHPYIGFVIDPMDYIPFIGATTKINHVPRGKSDTSGMLVILFHIPEGGPFLLAPMIGHDSVNFFGSKKVKVEGNLMSPSGHMLMTCNDIGLPLSFHPGKKFKPIPSMYLPTSFSIPLSFGNPVMVGGPYVPDWAGVLLNMIMSYGFGALMKGLGHLGGKLLGKFNHALQKELGSNKLSAFLCKKGFEPIDLVQGIMIYDGVDFELPGPIPFKWERSWNSDSKRSGLLGHGFQLGYDMRVLEFPAENVAGTSAGVGAGVTAVLLPDGRTAIFDLLPYPGDSDYNRHESLELTRTDLDEYELFDRIGRLYYQFRGSYLNAIRNEADFMISFHYDGSHRLVRVIDSAGRHLLVKNNANGYIESVTCNQRVLVSYQYNEDGDLTGITDALGQTTVMRYHHHLMTAKTDRNGQTFYWEYDKQHRCIHTWGDGGLLEGWIEYHPEDGYNLVTDALGNVTTYYYTREFVVTQIKDPLGFSKFFEYTEHYELYREIDEDGNIKGYVYDDMGNCIRVEQPDGSAFAFAYDADGRMILARDPQGDSRTYIYYPSGLLHTLTNSDGSMTVFRYNEQHLLDKMEDNEGRQTLLGYDQDHNLAMLTLPNGGASYWEYDAWGQCISTQNPLGQQRYFRYDELGRLAEISLPDGNQIQLQYNAYQEITRFKDKQREVTFEYTPTGKLKLRNENGARQHFTYDNNDRLTSVVNEHGEQYSFARNTRGDIISETAFDGQRKSYQRDACGKVIKVQRPDKRWSEYEYDFNGKLTRAEHYDGYWETFSYDYGGRLVEAVNEHSVVRFARDAAGRIMEETQNGIKVQSIYDSRGRRIGLQSSLGAQLRLDRDDTGEVIAMYAQTAADTDPWIAQITRDHMGLEIERRLTGGVSSSWQYDKAGLPSDHLVLSGATETRRRHYRWDANHQLRQINNTNFGYDELNNLAWAHYEDGQYDYRVPDKAGNLYKTPTRKDRKYTAGGRLVETADCRFIYDEEGSLIKKIIPAKGDVWEYEWYGNGLLRQVTRPNGGVVTYRYDAMGRRIEKQYKEQLYRYVWDANKLLHEWHYPLSERPLTAVDDMGNIVQQSPEPMPADTFVTWIFDEHRFAPAARISNGKRYSIITDHLGTSCEAYDDEGARVWSCELDIYGSIRKLAGDSTFVPFRFQGQYHDTETGLYYNRFRYYSPTEGVYISQDPIGLRGGLHAYSYVNTTDSVDPYGLVPVPPQGPVSPLSGAPTDEMMQSRAGELAKMYGDSEGYKTVAVAHAIDPKTGDHYLVVASNDNHLSPAIRESLNEGEIRAHGPGHAEVTAINFAKNKGLEVQSVAASRPICNNCEKFLEEKGVRPASALKSAGHACH
jgi:RHS repeat-associated protein